MSKSISTKNQVIDHLQWSTKQYEDRLFLTIWNWCQHYGQYPSIVQQLFANRQINRWFLFEYEKLELQFLKIVEVVPSKTETLEAHYKACTDQIFAIYHRPLIDAVKRNRDFSNIFLPNMPVWYAN